MYMTLKSAKLTMKQKTDINELIKALEQHLYPAAETRLLRSTMSSLKQRSAESMESFAMRVDILSQKAFSNPALREEAALSSLMSGAYKRYRSGRNYSASSMTLTQILMTLQKFTIILTSKFQTSSILKSNVRNVTKKKLY